MRKKYVFAMIAIVVMCICGCGNKGREVPEADKDREEDVVAVEETESEVVSDAAEEEVPVPKEEPEVEEEASEEEKFGEGYAYVLEVGDQPVFAFNSPYRPIVSSLSSRGAEFVKNDRIGNTSLIVTTDERYEMVDEEKMSIKILGHIHDITSSEEIETIYGTSKIYFSPQGVDNRKAAIEIMQIEINSRLRVTIYLDYTDEVISVNSYEPVYQGKLKKLLPIILEPMEGKEKKELVLQDNEVSVDTSSYELYLCESGTGKNQAGEYELKKMKPVLGFNQIDGWYNFFAGAVWDSQDRTGSGDIIFHYFDLSAYFIKRDENKRETFEISANELIYNYYFGERSLFDIEEKAEVETPFGIAKIYYVEREEDREKLQEEVAVLKNLGNTIVINYYWQDEYQSSDSGTYDGIYDGRLEELLPQLF